MKDILRIVFIIILAVNPISLALIEFDSVYCNYNIQEQNELEYNFNTMSNDELDKLIAALIQVESGGNDSVVGDTHLAEYSIGVLQIRPVMVNEVNRILRINNIDYAFTLDDRYNREKSIQMFHIWREYHHKNSSFEKIARNWNGGTYGYKKKVTVKYWYKVKLAMDSYNELNS